jgi:predicted nucleic acid-binding protein
MPEIDVVADANVALKWFNEAGEPDVEPARALLTLHRERAIALQVLDLTLYELGNALLRGHVGATAGQVSAVLAALREICAIIAPDDDDLKLAAELAVEHRLTLYDAVYCAVARLRGAELATLEEQILAADLGTRPAGLLERLNRAP